MAANEAATSVLRNAVAVSPNPTRTSRFPGLKTIIRTTAGQYQSNQAACAVRDPDARFARVRDRPSHKACNGVNDKTNRRRSPLHPIAARSLRPSTQRKINKGQPTGEEQHVCLEGDPIGERARDECGSHDNIIWYAMNTNAGMGAFGDGAYEINSAAKALEIADDPVPVPAEHKE